MSQAPQQRPSLSAAGRRPSFSPCVKKRTGLFCRICCLSPSTTAKVGTTNCGLVVNWIMHCLVFLMLQYCYFNSTGDAHFIVAKTKHLSLVSTFPHIGDIILKGALSHHIQVHGLQAQEGSQVGEGGVSRAQQILQGHEKGRLSLSPCACDSGCLQTRPGHPLPPCRERRF